MRKDSSWQIFVDTGGTFTDCIATSPSGKIFRVKVLSNSSLRGEIIEKVDDKRFKVKVGWDAPDDFIKDFEFRILGNDLTLFVEKYDSDSKAIKFSESLPFEVASGAAFEVRSSEEAPILATRLVTGTLPDKPLPNINMRLATTRGTNALLERKGAPTALFITHGFGDLLEIGNQQRPDIFALEIIKPKMLYSAVVEVEERIAYDGEVLLPIKLKPLIPQIKRLNEDGIRVAAVAFMNSYKNSNHETELRDFLLQHGFEHVSCSSEVAPLIKIVPRAETAVVDAYLSPVIGNYLNDVNSKLTNGRLHVMTSAGGLTRIEDYRAKDSLLSGPAGGVLGAAHAGHKSGFEKLIAFDMGGTSTDVARYDGDFEYVFEHQVADAHLVAPALAIESVAAGGGSICSFDGYRLTVGPESAGAQPGPACYGAGGPLALTDVNLLLGRLDSSRFEIPISKQAANNELQTLQKKIESNTSEFARREELLQGFLDIANECMADAIRKVSIRRGVDPAGYTLVSFGGAGGQHACGVAQRLGIKTILTPKDTSLLSALGLGYASLERFSERQVLKTLVEIEKKIPDILDELAQTATKALAVEGAAVEQVAVRRRIINVRFLGQDSALSMEFDSDMNLQRAFEEKYRDVFGHLPEGRKIEVESMRVVCSVSREEIPMEKFSHSTFQARSGHTVRSYFGNNWQEVPFYERSRLEAGAQIVGPALVFEEYSSTVIEPGWSAMLDTADALVMQLNVK